MFQIKPYLSVVSGVIVASLIAGGVKAQTPAAPNLPRPLEALGMTYDTLAPYLEPCQKECKQLQKEAKIGYRTTFNVPPYAYTVESGKVVEVMITTDSFEGFIDEGKEKWGPPKSLVYQAVPNPYGSETRVGTARWELPGGVIVDARQTPIPGKVVDVTKLVFAGRTTFYTQKEPGSEGAMVIITNPSAQRTEQPKPMRVL
jgi:hypothetical protein